MWVAKWSAKADCRSSANTSLLLVLLAASTVILIASGASLGRTAPYSTTTLQQNETHRTYNATVNESFHVTESAAYQQWYAPDEFSKFILQLLIPATVTALASTVAATYAARKDLLFALKAGACIVGITVSGILIIVVGLSQAIIPFLRGLNTPFSPLLGTTSTVLLVVLGASLFVLIRLSRSSGLSIEQIHFDVQRFGTHTGYQLIASVRNKQKVIIYELVPSIKVLGENLQLLRVEQYEENGRAIVECKLEPMREIGYVWRVIRSETERQGSWPELRGGDRVMLVYPAESTFVGFSESAALYGNKGRFMSTQNFLHLEQGVTYKILIEVKGANSNKTTVSVSKTAKQTIS